DHSERLCSMKIYLAGKVAGEKWNLIPSPTKHQWESSDGGNHSEHNYGYSACVLSNAYSEQGVVGDCAISELSVSDFLIALLDQPDSFGSIAEIAFFSASDKASLLFAIEKD